MQKKLHEVSKAANGEITANFKDVQKAVKAARNTVNLASTDAKDSLIKLADKELDKRMGASEENFFSRFKPYLIGGIALLAVGVAVFVLRGRKA